jgi:hypothetical protein
MAKSIACPICGDQSYVVMHKVIDHIAVTSDSKYSKSLDPHLVFCSTCSYWFTSQGRSLSDFYASEYVLLMQDFFTDQALLVNGNSVNRAEYQASLIQQIAAALGSRKLLEVGTGKGLTAHHVVRLVQPSSFVLHDPGAKRYESLWREHVQPVSSHSDLTELADVEFDLGFTFFTLEHTERPLHDIDILMSSLQSNSVFIGVVPSLSANPGDLLVGDHCSHFTAKSLARLLSHNKLVADVSYCLLINHPLRGLVYLFSRSAIKLKLAVDALIQGKNGKDFMLVDQIQETPDSEIKAIADRYWYVESSASGEKRELLWGAGFYSKLIMLRHHERKFSLCIDSNPSLLRTEFTDPGGRVLHVAGSNDWLYAASSKDRLWLGVSEAARGEILKANAKRLTEAGVDVAF